MLTGLVLINPYSNLWRKESCLHFTQRNWGSERLKHSSKNTQLEVLELGFLPKSASRIWLYLICFWKYCYAMLCLEWQPHFISDLTLECLHHGLEMSGLSDLVFCVYTLQFSQRPWYSLPVSIQTRSWRPNAFGWSILATQMTGLVANCFSSQMNVICSYLFRAFISEMPAQFNWI